MNLFNVKRTASAEQMEQSIRLNGWHTSEKEAWQNHPAVRSATVKDLTEAGYIAREFQVTIELK